MASADDLLIAALAQLPSKPEDSEKRSPKQKYSQQMSENLANALAEEFRNRGLAETRPAPPGEIGGSGAERRIAGGIGAKKVDVSWATEEAGLLLGISIKTINFKDRKSGHFQKNLTNRRGDMLFESVTLHRRFPYAVLVGFLFLDKDAAEDHTKRRNSTFNNAHDRFRIFTGRNDPGGRDEQYERLYIGLVDANKFRSSVRIFAPGSPDDPVDLSNALDEVLQLIAERNPDFYQFLNGQLRKL